MYPWLESALTALALRAQQGTLHHGLLLQGRYGIGTDDFARQLGACLLCRHPQPYACGECQSCKLEQANSHPDLHQIESEKQIGVDLIREKINSLTGTAQLSGAKVLIIHRADTMTEASANALLKTLEEPTGRTFLLLTTESSHSLLPTIVSRCEKVRLPESTPELTQQWLSQQGMNVSPELLSMYEGVPLKLLEMANQSEGVTYDSVIQALSSIEQQNCLDLANSWQGQCDEVIQWIQHWMRKQLQSQHWSLYQNSLAARQAIQNPGVNKVLILSALLSQIQQR